MASRGTVGGSRKWLRAFNRSRPRPECAPTARPPYAALADEGSPTVPRPGPIRGGAGHWRTHRLLPVHRGCVCLSRKSRSQGRAAIGVDVLLPRVRLDEAAWLIEPPSAFPLTIRNLAPCLVNHTLVVVWLPAASCRRRGACALAPCRSIVASPPWSSEATSSAATALLWPPRLCSARRRTCARPAAVGPCRRYRRVVADARLGDTSGTVACAWRGVREEGMGVGDATLGRTRGTPTRVGGRGPMVGRDGRGRRLLAGARQSPAASAMAARCRRGAPAGVDVGGRCPPAPATAAAMTTRGAATAASIARRTAEREGRTWAHRRPSMVRCRGWALSHCAGRGGADKTARAGPPRCRSIAPRIADAAVGRASALSPPTPGSPS